MSVGSPASGSPGRAIGAELSSSILKMTEHYKVPGNDVLFMIYGIILLFFFFKVFVCESIVCCLHLMTIFRGTRWLE